MVVELNSFMGAKNIGAKARFLVDANRFGYKTPRSIAIDTNEYLVAIRPIKDKIDTLMQRLSIDNIVTISKEINTLFDQVTLSEEASEKIISLAMVIIILFVQVLILLFPLPDYYQLEKVLIKIMF